MKTLITNSITRVASFIKRSQIAAFPTETVYGLGANVFDEKAVEKIFKVKKRPHDNPLIVHISDKKQIELLAKEISGTAKQIIKKFFPGPVTVILKKNDIVPESPTAGLNTIGVRMPSSAIARKFIKQCGVPIAAPSANLSGSPSPTSYRHVLDDFNGKIPCILKGPDAKFGMESTVVDCTSKIPAILRPGVITLEQLKKIDRKIELRKGGKLKSPGQKYRHYAPKAKVVLVNHPSAKSSRRSAVLPLYPLPPFLDPMMSAFPAGFPYSSFPRNRESSTNAYIGIEGNRKILKQNYKAFLICKNPEDYAKNLFSFFRECDRKRIKIIYTQSVPEKGIGLAIMNRLKKAAG